MRNLSASLRTKVLLLAIVPLVIVTLVITVISLKQARSLSEQEIETFEENLLQSKQQELQNYVEMATNAIAHLVDNSDPGDAAIEAEIKRIINELTYGEDGYFFVYDTAGVNIVHPIQPELVGENLIDLEDINGNPVIRELIRTAQEGGGFYRYIWRKPSKGDLEDKLSYVVLIPKYNWMMGTGLYIDDIAKEVAATRLKVTQNIRNTFFTVLVIVCSAVVIIALAGVALNMHTSQLADRRLRELAHRHVQFQVNQRRNFARELHDGINQLIVSVKFRLELAKDKLLSQDQAAEQELDKGCEILNLAIQEVRRVSHDLRPIQLDDLGLETALHSLAKEVSECTDIATQVDIRLPEQRLPDDIETTLYRVAQEALTNVKKHAQANNVSLNLWQKEDYIRLEVKDNGRGFHLQPRDKNAGIGIINMRERTELISGRFSMRSKPGAGTSIRVEFAL